MLNEGESRDRNLWRGVLVERKDHRCSALRHRTREDRALGGIMARRDRLDDLGANVPEAPEVGISGASGFRMLRCAYFRIASAALALSEACVRLPALHAASACFTSEAAFVMSARRAWAVVVAPAPHSLRCRCDHLPVGCIEKAA